MNTARSFTDIMRPPEIDACKAPMREAIWQLEAMGHKGGDIVRWLRVVLIETICEEDGWSEPFFRILGRIGDRGVMTGRFPSGWSGASLRQSRSQAFQQWRNAAKPAPVPRHYEDAAYGNELDLREAMMRGVVSRLQKEGYRGRHLSLALLEVLAETAAADSPATLKEFIDAIRDWGRLSRIPEWEEPPAKAAAAADQSGLN